MKIILLIAFTFMMSVSYGQSYIGTGRNLCKFLLKSHIKGSSYTKYLLETDSTITLQLRDSTVQNMDRILYFDGSGKCIREVITQNCDSCYQKYLSGLLNAKKYKWQKLSALNYISSYSRYLLLTTATEIPFSYQIEKVKLTKKEFEELLNLTAN